MEQTMSFRISKEEELNARDVLLTVYSALVEKGYNPINQLVGYLISGDPAYITSHKQARTLIKRVERDDLIEEVLSYYVKNIDKG
ncbi:MAG: IreB family regulatory phosphoprotein [Clostridiales bacterium]|nr:IreB family regulatory phosphoprotein [Clostridiales bacterium]